MSIQYPPICLIHSALFTPLGDQLSETMKAILEGRSGISEVDDSRFFKTHIPLSKIEDAALVDSAGEYLHQTRFDTLMLNCAAKLAECKQVDFSAKDTLIILSTTKGNIELIETHPTHEALQLSYSARKLQAFFKNPTTPFIVSNACISGISAFIVARRLLRHGQYKHVVIIGVDALSKFVVNGFNAFHALSKNPCKPFDAARNGISLGEAAAGVVLSSEILSEIEIGAGFVSNDANHISGPSKTGEELSYCIQHALASSERSPDDIDFISAHGTATIYNDEMESLAIEKSQLQHAPVFSLKGHFGHTLGASGVLELIVSSECLKRNLILPSLNFSTLGVSGRVTVNSSFVEKTIHTALKTGSGFGGCNAALVLNKLM